MEVIRLGDALEFVGRPPGPVNDPGYTRSSVLMARRSSMAR